MDKEDNTNNIKESKAQRLAFYKAHPYKSPKFLAKLVALALLGPLGWIPLEEGTTTLAQSALGNLVLLIFLLTALYNIAIHRAKGWLWFSAFFYYGAFGHMGIVAWVYMVMTGLALYVHNKWTSKNY